MTDMATENKPRPMTHQQTPQSAAGDQGPTIHVVLDSPVSSPLAAATRQHADGEHLSDDKTASAIPSAAATVASASESRRTPPVPPRPRTRLYLRQLRATEHSVSFMGAGMSLPPPASPASPRGTKRHWTSEDVLSDNAAKPEMDSMLDELDYLESHMAESEAASDPQGQEAATVQGPSDGATKAKKLKRSLARHVSSHPSDDDDDVDVDSGVSGPSEADACKPDASL